MPAASAAEAAVEAVFREEWGRITASLIAMTGAWLTTAARNRAIDVLRRRANEAAKLQQALLLAPEPGPRRHRTATSPMTGSG